MKIYVREAFQEKKEVAKAPDEVCILREELSLGKA